MKIKLIQNKSGRELIRVVLTKKDTFDYATASQLSSSTLSYLLPFTFSGNETRPNLYYDTTGCVSLEKLCGSKISVQQFESIITQLIAALDTISTSHLFQKNLLLKLEYVYVCTDDSGLRLVYLPLTGLSANDRAVLDLLQEFSAAVQFTNDEDSAKAQDFLSFLRKQSVFSVIAMKAYFGSGTAPQETRQPVQLEPLSKQPKAHGRDFVSESSGAQSRTQITEQRTMAENIIAAVSEDFSAPSQQVREQAPQGEPSAAITHAKTGETGTTFLTNWSTPLNEPSAACDKQALPQYAITRVADGTTWKLPQGQTIIGRSKSCDLQVSDSTDVSRQHAVLVVEGQELTICDKASRNGTSVKGRRIEPNQAVALTDAAVFELGDVAFVVSTKT